ncbi:MAG: LysR family transcriptional regulator [Eggerthellaceae bacterium]|nr:LysR family transcriptional regulator [Eggerthellaceae bacterium]
MNKDQLSYFTIVYRTRNIATAAAQVPMSTQGLSKSMRALESELGVPLFTIDANGGRIPTAYGDAFMRFAERVESEYDLMQHEFDRIRANEQRTIRLASALGVAGFAGEACATAFQQIHPDITVELTEYTDYHCDKKVREGAADLGLTLAPFDDDLITVPLYREHFFVWVNRANPLSQHETISMMDLHGQSLSDFSERLKCHATLMTLMEQAGAQAVLVNSTDEVFWHYQNAAENKALGLAVEHLTHERMFCQLPDVVAVPLEDMTWQIGLSYSPTRPLSEHERTFLDFAIEFFRHQR